MRRALALLLGLLWLGASGEAAGHGMRTGSLELVERSPTELELRFRALNSATGAGAVELIVPAGCAALAADGQPARLSAAGGLPLGTGAATLRCPRPLSGETLRLGGLGPELSEVVVLATGPDGRTTAHLVTAAAPAWRPGTAASARGVSLEYVGLGLRHILTGADHLLFLVLLVLAVRRARAVLLAETAFTLSHSLSFAATALGWVRVSAAAAEACIALSLLLLALDVERPGGQLLSGRRAALLALVFGLVHGLGFAGGLAEIGLPEQAAAWALAGFGLGVELGQVAFLLGLLGLLQLLGGSRLLRPVALVSTYAAGGLAACWLLERVLGRILFIT